MSKTDNFRVVVFNDGGCWIAQGLEHDICAQASDIDTLKMRFLATVALEVSEAGTNGSSLDHIPPAPQRFQDMWGKRAQSVTMTPSVVDYAASVTFGMAA